MPTGWGCTVAENSSPLLLSLNLDATVMPRLEERGWRVISGSLGVPYKVSPNGRGAALRDASDLPSGYSEADIVFMGLRAHSVASEPFGRPLGHSGEGCYIVQKQPVVDPRPFILYRLREALEQILAHGGVIVVFADERIAQPCELVGDRERADFAPDTWSFADCLSSSNLEILATSGSSVSVPNVISGLAPIAETMRRYSEHMHYTCTISPRSGLDCPWTALALNKYQVPVAGCIEVGDGLILIVPHFGMQLEPFLADLLTSALPEVRPSLFPDAKSWNWVHLPDYELPAVLQLSAEIDAVQIDAQRQVADLSRLIDETKDEQGYQYDLLRGTGQVLTTAVREALLHLGFEHVEDVNEGLREDLRVVDSSLKNEIVLVEVKGVGGLPSDDDATQVAKYVPLCMKDDGCLDVHGLSIINYERHIPPLERSPQPFRPDLVTSSESWGIGLLTTWDLFRLLRGMEANGWLPETVKPLLDGSGWIIPVPSHYRRLGSVTKFYELASAFEVEITDGALQVGDVIALDLPSGFAEQTVTSLHADGKPAKRAGKGATAGIGTAFTKAQLRKGTAVFRAEQSTPEG